MAKFDNTVNTVTQANSTLFNNIHGELKNILTGMGISVTASTDQIVGALFKIGLGLSTVTEDGASAVNTYVFNFLTGVTGVTLFNGLTVRGYTQYTNTGASTINVGGLGNIAIKKQNGTTAIDSGDITGYFELVYNSSSAVWILQKNDTQTIDTLTSTTSTITNLNSSNVDITGGDIDGLDTLGFQSGNFIENADFSDIPVGGSVPLDVYLAYFANNWYVGASPANFTGTITKNSGTPNDVRIERTGGTVEGVTYIAQNVPNLYHFKDKTLTLSFSAKLGAGHVSGRHRVRVSASNGGADDFIVDQLLDENGTAGVNLIDGTWRDFSVAVPINSGTVSTFSLENSKPYNEYLKVLFVKLEGLTVDIYFRDIKLTMPTNAEEEHKYTQDIASYNRLVSKDVTIASGVVNSGANVLIVDTEGASSSDNLDTISDPRNGKLVLLRAKDNSRTVVITDAGNIDLGTASNITLDTIRDCVALVGNGSTWRVEYKYLERQNITATNASEDSFYLSNDNIFKCGLATSVTGGSSSTITFNEAFPNACIRVFACSEIPNLAAGDGNEVGAEIISASQIKVYASENTVNANWLAIGY